MNEREIVKLLKRNPDEGLDRVISIYGRGVHTICISMLGGFSKEEIEEAESDVYIRVWKSIGRLREYESLKAYIYAVARNNCLDILRKKRVATVEIEEYMHPVYVDDSVLQAETSRILHEIIDELGPPDSRVFICRYFMMMKVKDIAKLLDIDVRRAENILARGRKKLREKLAERGINSYEEC